MEGNQPSAPVNPVGFCVVLQVHGVFGLTPGKPCLDHADDVAKAVAKAENAQEGKEILCIFAAQNLL